MICMQRNGAQQAGFLTPLWVIRSAMGFGLQLGWGGLSAASSLPGGSDKRPLFDRLSCLLWRVYIGLHLNIYEMVIIPVVAGYERYELFVNAV